MSTESTALGATNQPSLWNKNSWHWEEKNANIWAIEYIKNKFNNLKFNLNNINYYIHEVKLTGEAFVNLRKSKKYYGYELNGKLKFKGDNNNNEVIYEGSIELPEIAADMDSLELKVNISKGDDEVKSELKKIAKVEIQKIIDEFVAEFKEKF